MATITRRKTKGGIKFTAQIRRKGVSQSKTFSSLARAKQWAAGIESELSDIAEGQIPRHTLGEALERYSTEVSPGKRGGHWEQVRLRAIASTGQGHLKSNLPLASVTPALLAQWRDHRGAEVQSGTVLRELGLLSAVFQRAIREWGWMRENPVKMIAKPPAPAHRDKVLSRTEIRKILTALGHLPCNQGCADTVSSRVGLAFLFALRTGMRAGEICGLRWSDVQEKTAFLPNTKNGTQRHVPLSRKANHILNRLRTNGDKVNDELVFGMHKATLDTLFRRARDRAGLRHSGVVFHSTRHTAATWLAKKLTPYDLARMFGWKDLKMVMVYYNSTASDIANLLDR